MMLPERPLDWPRAVADARESADIREAALARLVFAQWMQRQAGAYLRDRTTPPHWVRFWGEHQRRAYQEIQIARAALAHWEVFHDA